MSSQRTQEQENKSNGLYIEKRHNRDSVYVVRDRTGARQLCRVYTKEVIEEAREEIELIHNLTRGEECHPRQLRSFVLWKMDVQYFINRILAT